MTADVGALMNAMGFTQQDLKANQQGLLSHAQAARLKLNRRRQTLLAAFFFCVLVVAASALIYAGQVNSNQILGASGVILILVNAILTGIAGRAYMRLSKDLRVSEVEVLAGEVARVLRRGRSGDNYLLRIDGCSIQVNRDIFLCFRHQLPYRIYRSANARLLLSAEPIG